MSDAVAKTRRRIAQLRRRADPGPPAAIDRSDLRAFLRLAAVALLTAGLGWIDAFGFVDRYLVDARMSLFTRPPTGQILVVALDAESLRRLEGFPLPRGLYGRAIDELVAAGAERIAVDVDFSARSDPEQDALLAASLARAGPERVALAVLRQRHQTRDGVIEMIESEPLALFRPHVSYGHVNMRPDRDGLVRRTASALLARDAVWPSLSSWLAGDSRAAVGRAVDIDFGVELSELRYISFVDLIEGRVPASEIRGKLVLIGATDLALGDWLSSPRYAAIAGVMAHALAAETILQNRDLTHIRGWPIWLLAAALPLSLGALLRRQQPLEALATAIGVTASIESAAALAQPFLGVAISTALFGLGVVLTLVTTLIERLERVGSLWLEAIALIRSNQVLTAKVVDNSFDAIITFDDAGAIRSTNKAAERMFGVGPNAPTRLDDVAPGEEARLLDAARAAGREEQGVGLEAVAQSGRGRAFPAELSIGALASDEDWIGVLSLRDISERKAQEAALEEMATHDGLTGLPNRALLKRRMALALEIGAPFAALLLDLDRFKEVNDTLGHATGDRLLQEIGPRVKPILREDDLIARLGGDEFAVLLAGPIVLRDAEEVAARICESLMRPFRLDDLEFELGVSIGLAIHPEHGDDGDQLMQRADVAMYQAKREQSGFALYDPASDRHSVRRLTLQGELRRAIDEDQLVLYHQPKVSTTTGVLKATEALVRWIHPKHGFMPPDEFIPMAERTGLVDPLTDWVVKEALRQRATWLEQGLRIPIAINLSAKSLADPDLPRRFRLMAEEAGQDSSGLIMEVTESAVMEDADAAIRVLERFRMEGFKLSLDDFGTGHSSFAYLQSMPVQELKIDRAFVLALEGGRQAEAIVKAIVNLAKELELGVVTEGVEDERVYRWLGAIGADLAQGYFLGKPMPADDLARWPENQNCQEAIARIQGGDPPSEQERDLSKAG